ncbi:MAG: PKD domain-containing protein [Bacteroidia bacterium]|nr:PKD domain-containing protein [Bacteroidia bacterium]
MQTTHLLTKRISLLLVLLSFVLTGWSQTQLAKTSFPASATLNSKDEWRHFWDDYGLGRLNNSGAQYTSKPITSNNGILTIPFSVGDWGGAGWQNSGAIIYSSQPRHTGSSIYVEFEIKFSSNFDWGYEGEQYRGGKFGGGFKSGSIPVGAKPAPGNFSITTMWRSGGTLDAYIYHAGQTSNWPDRQIYATIEKGRWYKFGVQITLNDPGQNNGKVQIWIDEQLSYNRQDFRFSDTGSSTFETTFGNFFGGNSDAWRSRTNGDIQYKYVEVWDRKPGGGAPSNSSPIARGSSNVTSGQAPLAVEFNGADSYDPDGTIASYSWDFGDGNQSTAVNPVHTYTTPGNYTASLTVIDNEGASTTDNMVIQVNGNDPGNACGDLESGWFSTDIGNVGYVGEACFDDVTNTYSVTASGEDIWGTADAFHYLYQPLTGDAEIVTRVLNIENTDTYAKGGLMIREDLGESSRYAMIAVNQNNYAFEYRTDPNVFAQSTTGSWIYDNIDHPTYLKLSRSGSRLTGYISEDGTNWTEVDGIDLSLQASVYIGVALTAHDNIQSNTSSFDNLAVTSGNTGGGGGGGGGGNPGFCSLPNGWNSQDIGNVGLPGASCYDDSTETFAIAASGEDIWGNEDSFHYLYQELDGNGVIIAKIDDIEQTHQFAKGGVMIREKLDAGSRHAMLVLNQNQRAFQYRMEENGITGPESGSWLGENIDHPYWVKLERTGNDFAGYISPDGNDWTLVGAVTMELADIIYVGLALTSHDNSALNIGAFKEIDITAASNTNFPVELLDFKGVLTGRGTNLEWSTARESNNHMYTIERSIDGSAFQKIGEMMGAGTTTRRSDYAFLDTDPVLGTMTYRLKQTDFDGTYEYLGQIEILNKGNFTAEMEIYPNPLKDGNLSIEISGLPVEEVDEISIIDMTGKLVYAYKPTETVSTISIPNNLNSGLYFVQLKSFDATLGKRLLIQ